MDDIRLHKISIDHFRGYRHEALFNINDTDLLILSGSNGMGKTSFFDAIEWGFTGKLFRFEEPNEEKNKSHFINFQPYENPAEVKIEFGNGKDNYTLTRIVTNFAGRDTDYGPNKSNVSIYREDVGLVEGEAANNLLNDIMLKEEWKTKVDFKDIFSQYHVLTQDKLKTFVNGLKGPERYNQISSIIGTHRFLKYGTEFGLLRKEIEDDIPKIEKKIELIKNEIKVLKENVSEISGLNIGIQKNLITYVEQIIKENNINIELDNNSISKNDNKHTINSLLEKILSEKKHLEQSISLTELKQRDYGRIALNKDEYFLNLKEHEKLKKFIPLAQKVRRLTFLSENLSSFNTFTQNKKELSYDLQEISDNQQLNNKEIEEIKNLNNLLDGLYNSLTKISNRNSNLNDKGLSLVTLLTDWNDIISNYDQTIKQYNNKNISSIDPLGLSISVINNKIKDNIKEIKQTIEEKQTNHVILEKLSFELNNLSNQEEKQKEVLQIAREFLIEKFNNNTKVDKCPVCYTDQDYNVLLSKIDAQLSLENNLIEYKLQEIDVLKKQIGENEKVIKKYIQIENDLLVELLSILKLSRNQLENTLNHLDIFKNKYSNQELEIKNKLNNINLAQKDLTEIVKEDLKLSDSDSNINDYLQIELQNLIETSIQFNLNVFTSDLKDFERVADYLNEKIKDFELNLMENQVNKFELNHSLDKSIAKMKSQKESGLNNLAKYEYVEKELFKILSHIDTDNNQIKIRNLKKDLESMTISLTELQLVRNRLTNLQESVKDVVGEMNEDILNENEQFINSIFNRIYPHPYYRNIKFGLETNRNDNKVLTLRVLRDQDSKEINPAYTFSSAQINVVAISIFLAMSLRQQCTNLKTILLDDPIQSMDDLNIFSFIDILRGFANDGVFEDLKKQFVLSTHDEKIYRLMKKKFRFINNKSISFIEYNNFGPKYLVK